MAITIDGTGTITGISAGGLPDGVIATDDIAAAAVTPAKLSQPFTAGTAVASTSGTSIDFTGIPSWAKRITVMFSELSTNGTSIVQLQIGDGGGIETTNYIGSVNTAATTVGAATITTGLAFERAGGVGASNSRNGAVTLTNVTGNLWAAIAVIGYAANQISYSACSKSLSDSLDRIRITTVNGTDTFDAGTINILYE